MTHFNIRWRMINFIAILIGLSGIMLAIQEARGPAEEHAISGDQMVSIDREEANGSGYIVDKQVFFDMESEYPSQTVTQEMTLGKGRYKVTVLYHTAADSNNIYAYSYAGRYREILTDQIVLNPNHRESTFYIQLKHGLSDFQIRINEGELKTEITEIRIKRVSSSGMILCNTLCTLLLFVSIAVFYEKIRLKIIAGRQLLALAGIAGIIMLAALPLGITGITESKGFEDLSFHLWRIEGIAQGLQDGFFPVRIYSEYLNGYGYANGIYYGNTLLYIPAVLRMIGYSVTVSYKVYILLIHILTAFSAYWSFRQFGETEWNGLVGCALYTLAPYRLVNIYDRAAVGEYTALCFIPLVFCGLWIICKRNGKREHTMAMAAIVAGCTGIVQSHILSAILTGLCGVAFIVWFWKSFLKKEKMITLLQAAFWIILLNLWFIVPLLDSMLSQATRINADKMSKIQKYGQDVTYLTGLIRGNEYQVSRSIGFVLLFIPVLWITVRLIAHYNNQVCRYKKEMTGTAVMGVGCLFLATNLFPYDFLCKNSDLFNGIIGKIQFPWRWLGVAGIFLIMLYCLVADSFREIQKKYYLVMVAGMIGVVVLQAAAIQTQIMNQSEQNDYYSAKGLRQSFLYQVYQGEYMAANADMKEMEYDRSVIDESNIMWEYRRRGNRFEINLENHNFQEAQIILPLQYYKGYSAKDIESGERLTVYEDDKSRVAVRVPMGFKGMIQLTYTGMWYWRVADIMSLAGILIFVPLFIWSRFCKSHKNMLV